MPKYCDASLTSNEPMPNGNAKAMLSPHAKEHNAHISGNNSTKQHVVSNPPMGKLGARGKQS